MNDEKFNNDERELIESCIKGDSIAQERLFKKYYRFMFGVCLRYSDCQEDAKEILQEGYIKVFSHLGSFKFEGNLINWMKRIMVNTAIDKYRRKIHEPILSDIDMHENIKDNETINSKLNKEDLLKCINTLPIGYRTIFNLFVIEGYSHKEIAEKLGINEGTSKSQLFKAKLYLKEMLEKMDY